MPSVQESVRDTETEASSGSPARVTRLVQNGNPDLEPVINFRVGGLGANFSEFKVDGALSEPVSRLKISARPR